MIEGIPSRPLLRYFGGKWQLRHWIVENLPRHAFYAEPFAGAASVLLAKEPAPRGEIINDLNAEVVNLFRVMQDRAKAAELMERLEWTPYAQAEFVAAASPAEAGDAIERARRLVVRSFMGIEGAGLATRGTGFRMGSVDLRRFDQDGQRTFRNCAKDWSGWKASLVAIQERLSTVMIYERDALEFIGLMDSPECLLYVDPPYDHGTRSGTRYAVEFTDHDALVRRLLACQAMVVVSGYSCEAYEPLEAAGWERIEKEYRANMSEARRVEVLWRSPNCAAASGQQGTLGF